MSLGTPVIDFHSVTEYGDLSAAGPVLEDRFGRLFNGGDSLHVYDGQSWSSYMVPHTSSIQALCFDKTGTIWIGALNEIGFFRETTLGRFRYTSLTSTIPTINRLFGIVWGCVSVGKSVYFVTTNKLIRCTADGKVEVKEYHTDRRLILITTNDKQWMHHVEGGLYELSEAGPILTYPSRQLPSGGIMGVINDENSKILVYSDKIFRLGKEAEKISSSDCDNLLSEALVTSACEIAPNYIAISSVMSGVIITDKTGRIVTTIGSASGFPIREILSLNPTSDGGCWCAGGLGIYHLNMAKSEILLNESLALNGNVVLDIKSVGNTIFAVGTEGVFSLDLTTSSKKFSLLQIPKTRYTGSCRYRDGLLLYGFKNASYYSSLGIKEVTSQKRVTFFCAERSSFYPDNIYLLSTDHLERFSPSKKGTFDLCDRANLPGECFTMMETKIGSLWLGTQSKGVLVYHPNTHNFSPILDPISKHAWEAPVTISGDETRVLIFADGKTYSADPVTESVTYLSGVPRIFPSAIAQNGILNEYFISYNTEPQTGLYGQGAGILTFSEKKGYWWKELESESLSHLGQITSATIMEFGDDQTIWIAGTAGLLRANYSSLTPLAAPSTPFIVEKDAVISNEPRNEVMKFSFKDHHVRFTIFPGTRLANHERLFQTGIGRNGGDILWSEPGKQYVFEYSDLSDGAYIFAARTVNSARMVGPSAKFQFIVLPPWYRTQPAFLAYIIAAALLSFGAVKLRERQIRKRNQELDELVRARTHELQQASLAKNDFIAGVSHEIRNPMNGVVGIAESLDTTGLSPASMLRFGLLRQCAKHLASLLEDVLDFSRLEAGVLELDPKPFDLAELLTSVVSITASESEKYGVPVEVACAATVPSYLGGDARRIRQILVNFISNAIKYSGRGAVRVTVWTKPTGDARVEVVFAVSDEGPGISAEGQKRLFTRFERGNDARHNRVPGTGLGLALCRGLADMMHGRIWLESEVGSGSCFFFSAPFVVAERPATSTPAVPVAVPGHNRALVVDDEEYNRVVLADFLEILGFEVEIAVDGNSALELASAQEFDVVTLDYDLPGQNGLEVCRTLRQLPNRTASALIVATTAFNSDEKRAACVTAGMDTFLGKPVTMERLRDALAPIRVPPERQDENSASSVLPAASSDQLANLRHLAAKKNVPLADELALFISELGNEVDRLQRAINERDSSQAPHLAHALIGRCGFIHERDIVATLRRIEALAGQGEWKELEAAYPEFSNAFNALKVKLASNGPIVQPA